MNRLKDRDQRSFGEKAAAVLTTGVVGAAAFYKMGGNRLLSEGVPRVNKFISEVSKDLYNKKLKDFTYDNISELADKHLTSPNSTLKTVLSESKEKMKLRLDNDSLQATVVRIEEMRRSPDTILNKLFKSEYKDEILENIKDTYENTEENTFQIKSLIDEIIEKRNLISHMDEDGNIRLDNNMISKFINGDEITNKEAFFYELIESVDDIDIKYKEYKEKHYNEVSGSYDIIENIIDKITQKDIAEKFESEKNEGIKNFLGDKALTLGDYLNRKNEFADQIVNINGEEISIKELLTDFSNKYSNIDNLILDSKNLRKDSSDNIIDLSPANEYKEKALIGLAGTIPGKLLKLTDSSSKKNMPNINLLRKGTGNLIFSNIQGESPILNNSYMQMFNKIYRINEDNSLEYIKKIDDEYSRGTAYGSTPRLFSKMMGFSAERKATNRLTNFLDIGTTINKGLIENLYDGNSFINKIVRNSNNVEQYNIIDKILDPELASSNPIEYRKNLKRLNSVFSNITYTPKKNEIQKIAQVVNNDTARQILNIIQDDDIDNVLNGLLDIKTLANNDLNSLIKTAAKDRNKAGALLSVKSDKITNKKEILNKLDIIRKEAFKEAMIKETAVAGTGKFNYNNIIGTLNKSDLTEKSLDNLKRLSHWAVIQNEGNLFNNNSEIMLEEINKNNLKVLDILTSKRKDGGITKDVSFVVDMADSIRNIKENYKELTTRNDYQKREAYKHAVPLGETMTMRKGYSPKKLVLDLLNNMNDSTKQKANLKKFGMQFIAGRRTPQYITDYTMLPYFLTDRLIQPFEKLGFGFSNKNTGSVLDQWGGIALKRIMPVATGITALSYLNYEVKNITGTSVTGALAQGVANVDLGLRRIGDATGIGHILQKERELNPITQYWLGDDYQDYSERKDYYENGYDEVRKGRWWAFGSASEFRGTKTLYFQPNYVKRINSNWKDAGLYGSSKEKWKHSWMPTPRHPLAPIRRMLDPYWLEKKHYNDRPYMKTAPLFSEGTPWGVVLNPTIGEMIKPVKNMHRNETRRGLTDPRTLIAERNESIKNKALNKNKENLFKLSRDGISNISYTPTALADSSKIVINLKASGGKINSINYNGIDYRENVEEISSYNEDETSYINNEKPVYSSSNSIYTSLESSKLGSIISNGFRKSFSSNSTQIISQNNASIKEKAIAVGSKIEKVNLADVPANMAAEKIATKQNEIDLRLITSKHDFINDTLFSGKQLSGIWGFIGNQLFKTDERKLKIETADNMVSFKRSFWDSNVGGLGGGVMEIARRFFPHNDHSITQINSIRNTMPEWIPNRFKVGDPYTKVQKGEMRLPGKGYESIHKLRPDEYGRYGSLDRMRILADIAPWSDEYKIWRDVASKNIKDSKGKKEIQEIKKRVEQQSKNHEFYNYKFLNTPTKLKDIIIKSVSGDTVVSTENETYSLAGIKLSDKNALYNYLQEGNSAKVEYLKSDKNNEGKIKSAIYVNGQNLNQLLVSSKQATKDNDDDTPMAAKALTGHISQLYGATMEAIAHAPIPFVHNKLMKIDTPMASYLNDRVYG